jgi:hypothetical protein
VGAGAVGDTNAAKLGQGAIALQRAAPSILAELYMLQRRWHIPSFSVQTFSCVSYPLLGTLHETHHQLFYADLLQS